MKKFLNVILAVIMLVALSVPCFAGVAVLSNGTRAGITDKLNFKGATVISSGNSISIDAGTLTANLSTTGTMTSSNATTIGWTLVSSANTLGTSMCTNACVFCINGQGTVGDMTVGCSVATADTCLCAGSLYFNSSLGRGFLLNRLIRRPDYNSGHWLCHLFWDIKGFYPG
jgi:hypothetical protein